MEKIKKSFWCILLFTFFFGYSQAQTFKNEPNFVGEVLIKSSDDSTVLLEKAAAQVKTKSGATVYIFGIGNEKTRLTVKGCCSDVRVQMADVIQLVVRAVDNNTDPLSIVRIFEFESKKKERRAETSSLSTFGGTSDNNLKLVPYTAEKFGESSYLITLKSVKSGEYGILVSNPNALDQKSIIISCFGID